MATIMVLSDDELRQKLNAYGMDVGPITPTTRYLYVNKLKEMEAKKKGAVRASAQNKPLATRSLLTFSSDESESENATNNELKNTRKLRRRRQSLQEAAVAASTRAGGLFSRGDRKTSPPNFTPPTTPPMFSSTPSYRPTLGSNSTSSTPTRTRTLRNTLAVDSSGTDSDITDSFVDRTTSSATGLRSSKYNSSTANSTPKLKYRGNELVRVVPQNDDVSASIVANHQHLHDLSPNDHGWRKDHHHYQQQQQQQQHHHPTANGSSDVYIHSQFRTLESSPPSMTNSQCISMILLGVVVLFFVVLGVLYVSVRQKDKTFHQAPLITECDESGEAHCSKYNSEKVLMVLNLVRNQLRYIAGFYDCNPSENSNDRKVTIRDIKRFLKDNGVLVSHPYENTTFGVSLNLFILHSTLGVRLYNSEHQQTGNLAEVQWLESVHGEKSFFCRLKQAFGLVLYQIFLGVVVFLVILLTIVTVHWKWKQHKEFQRQVMAMTENIICELQKNHEASLNNPDIKPYLAIPHVRDMLIPLCDRNNKLPVWEKAVEFLNNHDSRVRVECQNIEGELYQVWRWLQPQTVRENTKKLWQGKAFENSDTGVNAHGHSPTQCLKIRNMFDLDVECGDNWHVHIQDAILEKCEGINGIVHIKVDTSSREGCVYVKCVSPVVAGQVFRELHGWWFDGKLVTVRYLRLERYHERFPEAATAATPLKPSNNKRLSMASPAFNSFLEH